MTRRVPESAGLGYAGPIRPAGDSRLGSGSGGGAVRRPGTFIIPFAGCRQGTILAPRAARLPTAGSVAHGHATFWLRAAAATGRGTRNVRSESEPSR